MEGGKTMKKTGMVFIYLLLILGAIIMVFPFLWMIATSLKTGTDVYNISLIPKQFSLLSYEKVLQRSSFPLWFTNSIFIAVICVVCEIFFDSLVGYTFAKLRFKGKNILFIIILSTMMIPTEMLIIPWYIAINKIGLYNSYFSLLFPGFMSAFGVFLMKQFSESIPLDLIEAGRVEGMTEFGIFAKCAMPLLKPAISALSIFVFLGNWNAFLWPVIAIDNKSKYTLQVGLSLFSTESINQWDLIMAGAAIATIPVLIVFIIFQKQIVEGIQMTGLKG
jgi:multiple sugar transport system permease protein